MGGDGAASRSQYSAAVFEPAAPLLSMPSSRTWKADPRMAERVVPVNVRHRRRGRAGIDPHRVPDFVARAGLLADAAGGDIAAALSPLPQTTVVSSPMLRGQCCQFVAPMCNALDELLHQTPPRTTVAVASSKTSGVGAEVSSCRKGLVLYAAMLLLRDRAVT